VTPTKSARVFKNGILAGRLDRVDTGIEFRYDIDYLTGGTPIASTLPLSTEPRFTAAGAVPPFFAGLLPEGRRLSALRRAVKTSADDELSLLAAVGGDTIGDVQVMPGDSVPTESGASVIVSRGFEEIRFGDLIDEGTSASKPTLSGAQDKVSARMISVPLARRNVRYILKLNPSEYPRLVENEAFFLDAARRGRISVPASRIVYDRDGVAGLLVTRFDREGADDGVQMLAVEDACQALDLWPADKYNVTMEAAADALLNLTPARPVAAQAILGQVTYAWLTGNGDLHAKNIAVVDSPGVGQRISPAYDLPSTLFYDDATLALSIGGRDTLSATRIREFARFLELPDKAALRTLHRVLEATSELPEALEAAKLGFETRTVAKVVRQLASRHRDIARAALA
jgi:serine/threonine-protein kinase HipA